MWSSATNVTQDIVNIEIEAKDSQDAKNKVYDAFDRLLNPNKKRLQ